MPETSSGVVDDFRRRLAEAEEMNLNAADTIRGAEAEAAQAKRNAADYFHLLDIREKELRSLKEALGFTLETPLDVVLATLATSNPNRPR